MKNSNTSVVSFRDYGLEDKKILEELSKNQYIKALDLQANFFNTLSALNILQHFPNLIMLNLSYNQIAHLPNYEVLKKLVNLKIFLLHQNYISDWSNLNSVCSIPQLTILTMFHNPISSQPGYRHFLVTSIKVLISLDDYIVADEERLDDVFSGEKFKSLSDKMALSPFPNLNYNKSPSVILFELEDYIKLVYRKYEKISPIIIIQKNARMYKEKRKYLNYKIKLSQCAIKIQSIIRAWLVKRKFMSKLKFLKRFSRINDIKYKVIPDSERKKLRASKFIYHHVTKWSKNLKMRKESIVLAVLVQSLYRGWKVRKNYIQFLNITSNQKFYFLNNQLKILKDFLKKSKFKEYSHQIVNESDYLLIRQPEPSDLIFNHNKIIQLSSVSLGLLPITNKQSIRFMKNNESIFLSFPTRTHYSIESIQKIKSIRKMKFISKVKDAALNYEKSIQLLDYSNKISSLIIQTKEESEEIIEEIFRFNQPRREEPNSEMLIPILPYFFNKSKAALLIQKYFKSYICRKKGIDIIDQIVNNRAIALIQNWWKNTLFGKRMTALKEISSFVKKIKTSSLYLDERTYINLKSIMISMQSKYRFQEQKSSFGLTNKLPSLIYEGHNVEIRETVFPKWTGIQVNNSRYIIDYEFKNNVYALLQCSLKPATVVTYNSTFDVNAKCIDCLSFCPYIKFDFLSISDALARAAILALHTYDIKTRSFLRLFPREMMGNPDLIQGIYGIWVNFKITPPELSENITVLKEFSEYPAGKIVATESLGALIEKLSLTEITLKSSDLYSNIFNEFNLESIDLRSIINFRPEPEIIQEPNFWGFAKKKQKLTILENRRNSIKNEKKNWKEIRDRSMEENEEISKQKVQSIQLQKQQINSIKKEENQIRIQNLRTAISVEKRIIKNIIKVQKEKEQKYTKEKIIKVKNYNSLKWKKEDEKLFGIEFMRNKNIFNSFISAIDHQRKKEKEVDKVIDRKNNIIQSEIKKKRIQKYPIQIKYMDQICAIPEEEQKDDTFIKKYEYLLNEIEYKNRRARTSDFGVSDKENEKSEIYKSNIKIKKSMLITKPKGSRIVARFREELFPIIQKNKILDLSSIV